MTGERHYERSFYEELGREEVRRLGKAAEADRAEGYPDGSGPRVAEQFRSNNHPVKGPTSEVIDLPDFLGILPAYCLRAIIAEAHYRKVVYVRGYSTMRKAELLNAVCQRLDEPIIYKGVINWLRIWVDEGKYPQKAKPKNPGS